MKTPLRILTALLALASCISQAADNVHFSGSLVSEPCTLQEEDSDLLLEFDTVIDKYLYLYQRTKSKPFVIHLKDCNPAIMSTVNVTFNGTPDSELTDFLALDGSSTGKGIAIGLELADGTPLPINKASPYQALVSGSNMLSFNAYVQIQPTVLAKQSLVEGDFSATSTFILGYQ